MDRRSFFIKSFQKITQVAVEAAEERVSERATHWIRPPFALDEFDFLTTCTRCNACVDACPYDVIFPLAARLGASVAATPALDILNKGCHLCEDWPCVKVCEPGALKLPEMVMDDDETKELSVETPTPLPRMAVARINTQTCLPYRGPECGACAGSCPVPGALSFNMTKPEINPELCTGCGLCREVCIVSPKAIDVHTLERHPEE